ncbi:MAG: GNAT family N-acetyltransferase [Treponema sp.]|nr:GNAT family N-acetyltransferase [Treponema sp.]
MMNRKPEIRFAEEKDTKIILDMIVALAVYEKMEDQVVATEDLLKEWIFEKKKAEVIFVMEDGKEVGFALFFHNFSTFLGRAGIYLEDLFVLPEYRGKGYGKGLITRLAQIAVERGCGRLEWACLNWNQPSIDFYLSMGAKRMTDWNTYRITGETLEKLGSGRG